MKSSAVWQKFRPSHDLLWRIHQGGAEGRSRQKLIEEVVKVNQGLVVEQARRFAQLCREPVEDLIQEGNIGLFEAVQGFDPTLGHAFSSFAVPKIRCKIQHYLRDKGWGSVRPPRRVVEQHAQVVKACREAGKLGRSLTLEETAERMGFGREQWEWIVQARSNCPPVSVESEEEPLQIPADEPEEDRGIEYAWAMAKWAELPALQRGLISERFFAGRTIPQIAKRRGIGEGAIAVLIDQGLEQIRAGVAV